MRGSVLIGCVVLALAAVTGCRRQASVVTVASLLGEMSDRKALSVQPAVPFTARSWSSYDRHSVSADADGWFANADFNNFIRVEGDGSGVLVDVDGPGVLTRLWAVIARTTGSGIITVYVDGRQQIRASLDELAQGDCLGGFPFACALPVEAEDTPRAVNIYFPIPYEKHLKITYLNPEMRENRKPGDEVLFFYNAEVRTYPAGTEVESFDFARMGEYSAAVERAREVLISGGFAECRDEEKMSFDGIVRPGRDEIVRRKGPGAVSLLKLNAGVGSEQLKNLLVELTFDGETTVKVPAALFFGCGMDFSPYHGLMSSADAEGNLTSWWFMPYRESMVLALINSGKDEIGLTNSLISTCRCKWTDRSMHFGCAFSLLANKKATRNGKPFDVSFAKLSGTGKVVGTSLAVFNPTPSWFGEGDEKIYVDGEVFPSYFGTGTEDYFGFAFCSSNSFSHPFLSQPRSWLDTGGQMPGMSQLNRFRVLDAIPFEKSLKFDMELLHTDGNAVVSMFPVTFWYMKPEAKK